jgi:hypothetical protein
MTGSETEPRPLDPNWSRRVVVALVVVGALTLLGLIGAAFLPRWWAQRIGDQVGGSITTGTSLGLFYGFVFTLLPLCCSGSRSGFSARGGSASRPSS